MGRWCSWHRVWSASPWSTRILWDRWVGACDCYLPLCLLGCLYCWFLILRMTGERCWWCQGRQCTGYRRSSSPCARRCCSRCRTAGALWRRCSWMRTSCLTPQWSIVDNHQQLRCQLSRNILERVIHTFSQGVTFYLGNFDREWAGEGVARRDHRQHHGGVGGEAHVNIHCRNRGVLIETLTGDGRLEVKMP